MRKITSLLITALCCVVVTPIQARMATYFSHSFTSKDYSWKATAGIDTATTSFTDGYLLFNGKGNGDMTVTRDVKFAAKDFDLIHLECVYQGASSKIRFIMNYPNGTSGVFECPLQSNAEITQTFEFNSSKLKEGSVPTDSVKSMVIQIVGSAKDDLFGMYKIYGTSKWITATAPATDSTIIEAEDYDLGGFGSAFFTHITAAQNNYRPQDPYLTVATQSGESNGYVIQNMGVGPWATAKLPDSLQIGRPTRTYENLHNFYKQWVQYTINVTEDFTGSISLKTGVHNAAYVPLKSSAQDPYVQQFASSYIANLDGTPLIGAAGKDTIYLKPNPNDGKNGLSWKCYQPAVPSFSNVKFTKGTHVLHVESNCGQWFFDAIIIKNSAISGMNKPKVATKLVIYPNPAENFINISGSDVDYVITDITGVRRLAGKGISVNVSSLAPGLYFVTADGIQAKFLKK